MKSFAVSYAVTPSEEEPKGRGKFGSGLKEYFNLPRVLLILLIVVFLVAVSVKAGGQAEPFSWLFGPNGAVPGTIPDDIAKALGPILALALAIERLLEMVFDMLETNFQKIAKIGSAGGDGLKYIQEINTLYSKEMMKAKEALKTALEQESPPDEQKKGELIRVVEQAELRFREASAMWDGLNKDPKYVSWKRALSIWLGLFLGMVIAVLSEKGLFFYLNLKVPLLLDMLITGFIIGAGSGPLHSLIGILQSAKDSLSNIGSFAGLGPIRDELQEIRKKIEKTNP